MGLELGKEFVFACLFLCCIFDLKIKRELIFNSYAFVSFKQDDSSAFITGSKVITGFIEFNSGYYVGFKNKQKKDTIVRDSNRYSLYLQWLPRFPPCHRNIERISSRYLGLLGFELVASLCVLYLWLRKESKLQMREDISKRVYLWSRFKTLRN